MLTVGVPSDVPAGVVTVTTTVSALPPSGSVGASAVS